MSLANENEDVKVPEERYEVLENLTEEDIAYVNKTYLEVQFDNMNASRMRELQKEVKSRIRQKVLYKELNEIYEKIQKCALLGRSSILFPANKGKITFCAPDTNGYSSPTKSEQIDRLIKEELIYRGYGIRSYEDGSFSVSW